MYVNILRLPLVFKHSNIRKLRENGNHGWIQFKQLSLTLVLSPSLDPCPAGFLSLSVGS